MSGTGPARLDVSDVVVTYGGVQALDGAGLSAEPGSIVGLIGANGSGKTTMLDVISGLVLPRSGSVRVDGESLVEYLPEERASLGVVRSFQDCRLFPELSVEEVLLLTEDARRPVGILAMTFQMPWARRADRAKREAVDQVVGSFGLDRFRHHQIAQLSTGTRRVVDLASIVLARPRPPASPSARPRPSCRCSGGSTPWPTPPSSSSSTTSRWSSRCAARW